MIDRYFIKSFIFTCIFVGSLLGVIIGLSISYVWAAWSFLALILLFFFWFYRLGSKFISFITAVVVFSLRPKPRKPFKIFLEKARLEKE